MGRALSSAFPFSFEEASARMLPLESGKIPLTVARNEIQLNQRSWLLCL
jgi:hypothetical protein